jgi:hypothetical protein
LRDIARGHGAACLAHEPDLALPVEEDVVAREGAVGDPVIVQRAHGAPRLLKIVVADLVRL